MESDESGLCHLHRLGYSDGSRFTNVNCQSSCRANYSSCQFNADSVKAKAAKAAKVMSVTGSPPWAALFFGTSDGPWLLHQQGQQGPRDHLFLCEITRRFLLGNELQNTSAFHQLHSVTIVQGKKITRW